MTDKTNKYLNYVNAIADSIFEMSPEEVRAELEEYGSSSLPVKEIFLKAAKDFRQRRLIAAQKAYKEKSIEYFETQKQIPEGIDDQKRLLKMILTRHPRVREQLTLQHRDFTTIPDEDLPELLHEIMALGFLSDSPVDNDEGEH